MESMNSGHLISAMGMAVNGNTSSSSHVASIHMTSRSTSRSMRDDTPRFANSAKRRSRSGPLSLGRSQTSHHDAVPRVGSPSDCQRSCSTVDRMRAMLATSSLLRGLPVGESVLIVLG